MKQLIYIFGLFPAIVVVMASQSFKLLSGDSMPLIGFGTYLIKGQDAITNSLDAALAAGYRSIDTAYVYQNEGEIGNALKTLLPKYNLTRKDLFITSKLPPSGLGPQKKVHEDLQYSLNKLQLDYLDLYLIHWPGPSGSPVDSANNSKIRDETWEALVDAKNKGWVRNIGVSNYNVKHLNEVIEHSHGVIPAVNQIEWHPLYHPDDVLKLCQDNKILLEAYSSLGGTKNSESLVKHPVVTSIAEKLGKSTAQVLLRWAVQRNIAVIPKSTNKEHIKKNIELDFEIPEEDMKTLDKLPRTKFAWDPDTVA